jgi:hypothetical protein
MWRNMIGSPEREDNAQHQQDVVIWGLGFSQRLRYSIQHVMHMNTLRHHITEELDPETWFIVAQ